MYAANGQSSGANAEDSQLESVQSLFNDVNGTGLGTSLSALFSSFGTLSANPSDPTSQNGVLSAAQQFVQAVSSTASNLTLDTVHRRSGTRACIANQRVRDPDSVAQWTDCASKGGGQDASDLQDTQDADVTSLSNLASVSTFTDGNGNLVVRAAGTTLVEGGTANSLQVAATANGNFAVLSGPASGAADVTSQVPAASSAGYSTQPMTSPR